jgi:protein ImuB
VLLCVSIADYPLAVVRRAGDSGDGNVAVAPIASPLIIADRPDRGHVLAVDERAADAGARVGQTVTQAVAAAGRACVAVYDPADGRALWEELLDALDAVSPLVDDVRPGLAYLDMRGIAGEPADWIAQTHGVVEPFGMPVRLGAGGNKIAARAAAHCGGGVNVWTDDQRRARLDPLPLALLDLDAATLERLRLLGIERLGDLARLPHGPFVRRFGPEASRWHQLARGIDTTPFVPRGHSVAIEAAMFGEGRADDEAQVVFAMRMLLARICADLERCGKRAGALRVEIELEDADTLALDVPLASPTAAERPMLDIVRAKLEGMTFAAPITGLRVRAAGLEEGGEAVGLFAGADLDPHTIALAIARLEAILGEPVRKARIRESHVLEERFEYESFEAPPEGVAIDAARSDAAALPFGDDVVPQLRLLAVAEIDVRVKRGEPAFVGEPPQAVIECAGPWRVEMGWFSSPIARDEYDVLLEDGALYRIYRQGTRWYLRGAYD